MRLKLLLFSVFVAGILNAQVVCTYPEGVNTSLIISEARMTSNGDAYMEITNMGTETIRLSDFKFGTLNPWVRSSAVNDVCNDPWYTDTHDYMFLPDRTLEPGKSFVITNAYDYGPEHYVMGMGRLGGSERPKQTGIYEVADKLIHREETVLGVYYPGDSVTTALNDPEQLKRRGDYSLIFDQMRGGTLYLEHHYTDADSAVIDQVGGVFDNAGRNYAHMDIDISGVVGGLSTSIVVRKAYIVRGNVDFANSRGISIDDSEWIPIQLPDGYNSWRDVFWTIGNHGNFVLDATTLEPLNDAVTVDYASKKITVPWGIERLDEIMRYMKKRPGVAWRYDLNPSREDSLYRSARTGDKLTVYVVGNTLQSATFEIEVNAPTANDNLVIPIDHPIVREPGMTGLITTRSQNGILSWPRVTKHENGIDTITGSGLGLGFDLRTDSLLKYLEKPANANWEFVWVDGVARPDLKDGDKLKVTSQSGLVKEYHIQVQSYNPSSNADLSAITWPDIPEFYRGLFGWTGDTIPKFTPGGTNYRIEVPFDVEGIPALKAKTTHVNASVVVMRAKSLSGTLEDRTVTFEVTAENDTVHKSYKVELVKEKTFDKIEPFIADPFISEYVNTYPNGRTYLELYNPGNKPLDLRNYMVGMRSSADLYAPVTYNASWLRRYTTYIPGLKHVDEATWAVTPRIMMPDPNVNPIVQGGGTFVMALITRGESYYPGITDYTPKYDVQFWNEAVPGITNPWNEDITTASSGGVPMPPNGNRRNCIFLYRILNDSIKLGLKPNTDSDDFELIDVMGMPENVYWIVGDYALKTNETGNIFIRKPHINKGNPVIGGSFGLDDPENSEWIRVQPGVDFSHIPTPARYLVAVSSLNQHYMLDPTFYKSTVNSSVYKVSDGFGPGQKIEGLKTGITVAEFLGNINKEDENQSIKVTSAADGSELGMDAVIGMNDVLVVVAADNSNTTLYRLDVTATGLSNNAYLTSTRWNIVVSAAPKSAGEATAENDGAGSISGFDYGTTIKTVVDNVNVPVGATVTVIDGNGAYVPFTILNFDTTYVSVTVNPDIYLDVVAEDNVTRMVYQLKPNTSGSDAFILSDVYEVSQLNNLINFVPRGTNFDAFLANIIPSLGASLKLVDKMGFERTQGNIREDDKVVVTSSNGQSTRVYFISFLPTSTILQTTYLAYVLSEAYVVDQVGYSITGGIASLTAQTMLDEFLSYIIPSMGATAVVVDKNGNVRSSGDLNDGDKLRVTSADGKIETIYALDLDLTSAGTVEVQQQISIYPNPASDRLHIQGVESGNRIQIYSVSGSLIQEVKAQNRMEIISLEHVPSGIFVIVISNDDQLLGRYKAIRK